MGMYEMPKMTTSLIAEKALDMDREVEFLYNKVKIGKAKAEKDKEKADKEKEKKSKKKKRKPRRTKLQKLLRKLQKVRPRKRKLTKPEVKNRKRFWKNYSTKNQQKKQQLILKNSRKIQNVM